MCWNVWEFCFEVMKKRWKVKSHRNKGQDGLPEDKVWVLSEEKNCRKKASDVVWLWSPRDKNQPREKHRNIFLFLPEYQGLCPEGLWVKTEAVGAVSGRESIRNGVASLRIPAVHVLSGVFYKWLEGSRLLKEAQSSEEYEWMYVSEHLRFTKP